MRGLSICFFLNLFVCLFAKGQKITTRLLIEQNIVSDTTKRNINVSETWFK